MTNNRPLRVFLCHSKNDIKIVRELYEKLRAEPWIDPWLDEEELYPGQDWNMEIEKAIEATDVILVCLSNNSITKEGYVQREIRIALDYADYKPEGTVFIIPVRLEDCKPSNRLSKWQYVDYFDNGREMAFQKLLVGFKMRAKSIGLEVVTLPSKFVLSNGMEFMHVPAGEFLMGDTNEQHTVNISYDYWMARYPVTNRLYEIYVKASQIRYPESDWEYKYKNKKDHPVVNITWEDTMFYCEWLNSSYRGELASNLEIDLPSEAEWEKAARGVDGRSYPWGNEFDQKKCISSQSEKHASASVGSCSPQGDSPYGCADMVGNVCEWTHSLKKDYPYKADDKRERWVLYSTNNIRVVRGEPMASCTYRLGRDALMYADNTGFRVCLVPPYKIRFGK